MGPINNKVKSFKCGNIFCGHVHSSPISMCLSLFASASQLSAAKKQNLAAMMSHSFHNFAFCHLVLLSGNTKGGKYRCTVDLLFDWFGLVCFAKKSCQLSYC